MISKTLKLSVFLSVLCVFAVQAFAGYTITAWQQPDPLYIPAYRDNGQQLILNRGVAPERLQTYIRQICEPRDIYSPDPLLRSEVWEDSAGTAINADLFNACPQIRAEKEREIRSGGSQRLAALANPYTPEERETWSTQQREARAWLLNNNADVPMIFAMATVRGITIEQMVGLIMENVGLFEFASGYILGQQQRLLDRIAAETDFATLLSIGWEAQ